MSIEGIPQHPVPTTDQTFDTIGLSPAIVDVVRKFGFVHPTPIQAAVIPLALKGVDVIGLAQTGSGKTAAFVLPLAERLTHGRGVRGLILSPTREIALQTKAFLDLFGAESRAAHGLPDRRREDAAADRCAASEPDIVVATPGRLLDHVRQRHVKLDAIETSSSMKPITCSTSASSRRCATSCEASRATADDDVLRDDARLDRDDRPRVHARSGAHRHHAAGRGEGITPPAVPGQAGDKRNALLALLNEELGSTLVFTRRKIDAEWLYHILSAQGTSGHAHSRRPLAGEARGEALTGFRRASTASSWRPTSPAAASTSPASST
jgi:superfamily II DNA/RNA helicase